MRDSLPVQAELAPTFMAQAWPALLEQARERLDRREDVSCLLICGCGDSHFAALGAEHGLRLWTGRPVRASSSMPAARYLTGDVDRRCLVVGISASGEVARTIEAIEQARDAGAQTLALTCLSSSSLSNVAGSAIVASLPEHPFGPGLLSYLASLLGLYAIGAALSDDATRRRVNDVLVALPECVAGSAGEQAEMGREFAEQVRDAAQGVFLGSGPGFGAAGFAAAKVLEACGLGYHGQDLEEWAHLEYFHATPQMPTWILTADGRDATRAAEVESAARAVRRSLAIARWPGRSEWSMEEREAVSPLGLWPAPVAFAHRLMQLLGEEPFRAFGGGRSRSEGGGPSRIRTSQRIPAVRRARGA